MTQTTLGPVQAQERIQTIDIIRGIAMVAGEAPENTKVIGASTGSIILVLAATSTLTGLLALISKHVISVAKDVVEIRNQIEDLRAKKMLNVVMQNELQKMERDKKSNALAEVVSAIKAKMPDLDGGQITALEASVKKLLTFNEKGGNVDFVAPQIDEEKFDDLHENEDGVHDFRDARALIHDYQKVREQIKMLEDRSTT